MQIIQPKVQQSFRSTYLHMQYKMLFLFGKEQQTIFTHILLCSLHTVRLLDNNKLYNYRLMFILL